MSSMDGPVSDLPPRSGDRKVKIRTGDGTEDRHGDNDQTYRPFEDQIDRFEPSQGRRAKGCSIHPRGLSTGRAGTGVWSNPDMPIRGGDHTPVDQAGAYIERFIDTFCRAQIG